MDWWETVILSLFSGLAGSIITLLINHAIERKRDRKKYKKEIFEGMIAYRGDIAENYISTGQFIIYLNQVFIAFNDNSKVIDIFEKYRKDKKVDDLITLFKEMANDLGIHYQFADDDLFMQPLVDHKLMINR